MKRTLFVTAVFFVMIASSSYAEERWSQYWACENKVLRNVEQSEPSVLDGAELIVTALCVMAATDLANDMVRERNMDSTQSFGSAFTSALAVVQRETAIKLYNARVLRMGLKE